MSRVRLYPHRVASAESVDWSGWWTGRGDRRQPLPTRLSGWDYASEETVGITATIHVEQLLHSSGVQRPDWLEFVVRADCPSVQQRFIAKFPLGLEGEPTDLTIELPPGQLAVDVRLSAHIVLAKTVARSADRTAYQRGARIASSDSFTLQLEGDGTRFPTESAAFSLLGLEEAPWTLMTTYEGLDDAFMGGVRLLINTEHRLGQLVLQQEHPAGLDRLLFGDVFRMMVADVATRNDLSEIHELADGSIGAVLAEVTDRFLQRSLLAAAELYRHSPVEFEALVQDRLAPYEEVFK